MRVKIQFENIGVCFSLELLLLTLDPTETTVCCFGILLLYYHVVVLQICVI